MDTASGTFPNVARNYLPLACQHCENAPCVKVCPVGATYKRQSDGVVLIDYERCIGCRYCMAACPYGVRTFNWGNPEYASGIDFPLGHQGKHIDPDPTSGPNRLVYTPSRPKGVVEKCSFCVQRIDQSKQPFCVECCPQRARVFGDLDDPTSQISQSIAGTGATQLLPELGTSPKVYFAPPRRYQQIINAPFLPLNSQGVNQSSAIAPDSLVTEQAEEVGGYIPGFEPPADGVIVSPPPPKASKASSTD